MYTYTLYEDSRHSSTRRKNESRRRFGNDWDICFFKLYRLLPHTHDCRIVDPYTVFRHDLMFNLVQTSSPWLYTYYTNNHPRGHTISTYRRDLPARTTRNS